jgi:hypothetical protein
MISQFVISMISYTHGVGRHAAYVKIEDVIIVLKIGFAGQILWIWSLTFIKLSVTLSLIRITPSKRWQAVLYCFVGFLVASALLFVVLQLIQCQPISGSWNPGPGTKCWSRDSLALSGYISGGMVAPVLNFHGRL